MDREKLPQTRLRAHHARVMDEGVQRHDWDQITATQLGGRAVHAPDRMQDHAIVPRIVTVAMSGPVPLVYMYLHVAADQPHTFFQEQRVAKVGACGGARSSVIDNTEASTISCSEGLLPGSFFLPEPG